jgi:hypothetical protein
MYPLLLSLNGVEYARLVRLAHIKTKFNWISETMRKKALQMAGFVAGDQEKILTQEYFCSELVVYVLTTVGFPVLKNPAQCPDEISPNDLSNPAISNLIEIPRVVCSADSAVADTPINVLGVAKMQAQVFPLKRFAKATKELAKLTESIVTNMRESIEKRRKSDH